MPAGLLPTQLEQALNSVTIANQYSPNSSFCDNGPTEIVDVVNPVTGNTWMDRNLGAKRAATLDSTNQVQFLIGGAGDGPYPGGIYGGFNGKLDDIGFWSRALTEDEILKIYQGKRF